MLGLFLDPEDRGDMFPRNVDQLSTDYTTLYPRREKSLCYIYFHITDPDIKYTEQLKLLSNGVFVLFSDSKNLSSPDSTPLISERSELH
jgi:hypothetical protein